MNLGLLGFLHTSELHFNKYLVNKSRELRIISTNRNSSCVYEQKDEYKEWKYRGQLERENNKGMNTIICQETKKAKSTFNNINISPNKSPSLRIFQSLQPQGSSPQIPA